MITRIGTYLPLWSGRGGRRMGPDEDAVTMAVEAGRAAVGETGPEDVGLVVLVTRTCPSWRGATPPPSSQG